MSTVFRSAFSAYEALRVAEHTVASDGDEGEQRLHAATIATDAAFSRLIRLPATNGTEAAVKLTSAIAHYPGFGGGMDERDLALVVMECTRFLIGSDLQVAA